MILVRYPGYRWQEAPNPQTPHLHDNALQIAAERGLPCLVMWLWLVAAAMADAYREARRGLFGDGWVAGGALAVLAAVMTAGLFEYNFGDSEVLMFTLLVAALPYALRRERERLGLTRLPARQEPVRGDPRGRRRASALERELVVDVLVGGDQDPARVAHLEGDGVVARRGPPGSVTVNGTRSRAIGPRVPFLSSTVCRGPVRVLTLTWPFTDWLAPVKFSSQMSKVIFWAVTDGVGGDHGALDAGPVHEDPAEHPGGVDRAEEVRGLACLRRSGRRNLPGTAAASSTARRDSDRRGRRSRCRAGAGSCWST